MADMLGDADLAGPDDVWEPRPPRAWQQPAPLALFSLITVVLTLEGATFLRGGTYTSFFLRGGYFGGDGSGEPNVDWVVAGGFLSAAFVLLPLVASWSGTRRLGDDDPAWVRSVLRASWLLSVLSLVLHVVAAVLGATNGQGSAGLQVFF
jgi:hypothetical protein